MVCKTCGSQLTEQDKFCRYCGTTVETAPQQAAPVYVPQTTYIPQSQGNYNSQPQNGYAPQQPQNGYAPQPEAPKTPAAPKTKGAHRKPDAPKKGGKKGLIIGGGIAAALLVIALVVVLILTGNPTVQVATAFKNTADAFTKIADVWHAEEAAAISQKEAVSITADVQLETIGDEIMYEMVGYYYYDEEIAAFADALSGVGIRIDTDVDLENREMGLMTTVHKGSADLVTAMVSAEDSMIYLGLPDFLDDFYGLDTETAMADLEAMGADLGDASQISFNIFELIEIVQSYGIDDEEFNADMTAALTDLAKDIEIEKVGKKNFKVGGESLNCKAYSVVIPQDSLEELLDVILEYSETDTLGMMEELCDAIGLPDYLTEELLSEMRYSMSTPDFDDVYEVLDVLEDIELTVYVKSNKVAGIVYEKKVDGEKLTLSFGIGGDRYGDLFEVELKVDGAKLTVKFEGDHTAKDGVFTDKATLKVDDVKLTMNTKYDPKSGDLSVKFGDDDASFRLEGIYMANSDMYILDLDEFSFTVGGEEQLSVSMLYQVTDYEKRVKVSDVKLLTQLTEDDIMDIATEVEENAMEWTMEFMTKYPEFLELMDLM